MNGECEWLAMMCDECFMCMVDGSHAVDCQILTNGRRHRVCYESADRAPSSVNATRSLFLRCTDIYITDNVIASSLSTSELQRSIAQLCCSVLNPRLTQFNVQPATPIELRILLQRAMVSMANALILDHLYTSLSSC